ncbi:MAG TPA: hypothetical protein VMT18_02940 [Planctomycetota bacterium]|nr:hypothetical protein [Planctomycetota bacterium]
MSHAQSSTDLGQRLGLRDLAFAAALFTGLLIVFEFAAQDTLYGDGESMLRYFAPREGPPKVWSHTLLTTSARALRALGVGSSDFESLRAVSQVAAAAGGTATFLLARGWGARRVPALAAGLLLASAPTYVFYGTTIEIHVLHAACFAIAGCAVVFAPWQRPALAVAVSSLALPLICLSHETGPILGAGLVAMAQVGRERLGLKPLSLRALCFGVGPAFLLVVVAAFVWNIHLGGSTVPEVIARDVKEAHHFSAPVTLDTFLEIWLEPLGLILPAAVAAVIAGAVAGWRLAALAATFLPSLIFFTSWGVIERGGYALPSATVLAVCSALLLSRARAGGRVEAIQWLMVALHALFACATVQAYVGPRWEDISEGRSTVVHNVLGSPCVLYSINYRSVFIEFPGANEVNLYPYLVQGMSSQATPDEFADDVFPLILADVESGASVGLDMSYYDALRIGSPLFHSYMEALQDRLRQHLWVQLVDDPLWPVQRLRPRP